LTDTIHPDTRIGTVSLNVTDIERSIDFYQSTLGFKLKEHLGQKALLSSGDGPLLALTGIPGAHYHPRATGLYHFAILTPSRLALARSLEQLARREYPLGGVADHGVSEALYLSDPDGNGIEIYRDRPRSEWPRSENGKLKMVTDPLDLDGLAGELTRDRQPWGGLDPRTVIGHVHLQVASVPEAEKFYVGVLGFELTDRFGPSAGFVSAGGYHHHIAFNNWNSAGSQPPPPESVGLRWFSILLPNQAELERVAGRVKAAGLTLEERPEGLLVRDPSQNGVILAIS
jgi:catechol 2,3-dioxygenase